MAVALRRRRVFLTSLSMGEAVVTARNAVQTLKTVLGIMVKRGLSEKPASEQVVLRLLLLV